MPVVTVKMEGDSVFAEGFFDSAKARHLLRDAIDDIADAIEIQAKREAPEGETGRLKLHPVDRDDTTIGVITGIFAFGGGFTLRAPTTVPGVRGRPFVRGVGVGEPGRLVVRTVITVADKPEYAKWVHDGTGIYGPYKTPIVPRSAPYLKFRYKGRLWRLPSVKGQKPQPFLREAYFIINRTFVPIRIEQLRTEIRLFV